MSDLDWAPPDRWDNKDVNYLRYILLQMGTFVSDCKVLAHTPTVDLAFLTGQKAFHCLCFSVCLGLHTSECVCALMCVITDFICPESFLAVVLTSTSSSCSRAVGAASSTSPIR